MCFVYAHVDRVHYSLFNSVASAVSYSSDENCRRESDRERGMSFALCTYREEDNAMLRFSTLTASLFLGATLAAGCAIHQRTETVETSSDPDSGVLSGTVNAVGEVISLPFRAVGGFLRAIF